MTSSSGPSAFDSLALPPELAEAVRVLGFDEMTPIQAASLPAMWQGRDIIAKAQTGSGKTVAFGLAALRTIDLSVQATQVLVLCPTRELADQVSIELRKLGRFMQNLRVVTLCGGVPVRTQKPSLEIAPHILVGTPGRMLDHLARETISLSQLQVLVLDEADRMLDMGFFDAIGEVVAQAPAGRQTLLFSATYPDKIRQLSASLQREPAIVTVAPPTDNSAIEQVFYFVENRDKLTALVNVLLHEAPESCLIFCNTRAETRSLQAQLQARGFAALALQGELTQRERDEVLLRFANGSARVLVATDVAARGLDIKELELVVAWELAADPHVHLHRIGRTGRAGSKGKAVALCNKRDNDAVVAIEVAQDGPVRWGKLPSAPEQAQPAPPLMKTLLLEGGKQDKLRPGDLLGALTGDVGLAGTEVGKIVITPRLSYVAVAREKADFARAKLGRGKIKGKSFRVWLLGESNA